MMHKLLVVVAALFCAACDSPEFNAQKHPDGGVPRTIYIRDAFGECYALRDMGKYQSWVHMKDEVCKR